MKTRTATGSKRNKPLRLRQDIADTPLQNIHSTNLCTSLRETFARSSLPPSPRIDQPLHSDRPAMTSPRRPANVPSFPSVARLVLPPSPPAPPALPALLPPSVSPAGATGLRHAPSISQSPAMVFRSAGSVSSVASPVGAGLHGLNSAGSSEARQRSSQHRAKRRKTAHDPSAEVIPPRAETELPGLQQPGTSMGGPNIRLWDEFIDQQIPGEFCVDDARQRMAEDKHIALYVGQDDAEFPQRVLETFAAPGDITRWKDSLKKKPLQRRVMIFHPRRGRLSSFSRSPLLANLRAFLERHAQTDDMSKHVRVFAAIYTSTLGVTDENRAKLLATGRQGSSDTPAVPQPDARRMHGANISAVGSSSMYARSSARRVQFTRPSIMLRLRLNLPVPSSLMRMHIPRSPTNPAQGVQITASEASSGNELEAVASRDEHRKLVSDIFGGSDQSDVSPVLASMKQISDITKRCDEDTTEIAFSGARHRTTAIRDSQALCKRFPFSDSDHSGSDFEDDIQFDSDSDRERERLGGKPTDSVREEPVEKEPEVVPAQPMEDTDAPIPSTNDALAVHGVVPSPQECQDSGSPLISKGETARFPTQDDEDAVKVVKGTSASRVGIPPPTLAIPEGIKQASQDVLEDSAKVASDNVEDDVVQPSVGSEHGVPTSVPSAAEDHVGTDRNPEEATVVENAWDEIGGVSKDRTVGNLAAITPSGNMSRNREDADEEGVPRDGREKRPCDSPATPVDGRDDVVSAASDHGDVSQAGSQNAERAKNMPAPKEPETFQKRASSPMSVHFGGSAGKGKGTSLDDDVDAGKAASNVGNMGMPAIVSVHVQDVAVVSGVEPDSVERRASKIGGNAVPVSESDSVVVGDGEKGIHASWGKGAREEAKIVSPQGGDIAAGASNVNFVGATCGAQVGSSGKGVDDASQRDADVMVDVQAETSDKNAVTLCERDMDVDVVARMQVGTSDGRVADASQRDVDMEASGEGFVLDSVVTHMDVDVAELPMKGQASVKVDEPVPMVLEDAGTLDKMSVEKGMDFPGVHIAVEDTVMADDTGKVKDVVMTDILGHAVDGMEGNDVAVDKEHVDGDADAIMVDHAKSATGLPDIGDGRRGSCSARLSGARNLQEGTISAEGMKSSGAVDATVKGIIGVDHHPPVDALKAASEVQNATSNYTGVRTPAVRLEVSNNQQPGEVGEKEDALHPGTARGHSQVGPEGERAVPTCMEASGVVQGASDSLHVSQCASEQLPVALSEKKGHSAHIKPLPVVELDQSSAGKGPTETTAADKSRIFGSVAGGLLREVVGRGERAQESGNVDWQPSIAPTTAVDSLAPAGDYDGKRNSAGKPNHVLGVHPREDEDGARVIIDVPLPQKKKARRYLAPGGQARTGKSLAGSDGDGMMSDLGTREVANRDTNQESPEKVLDNSVRVDGLVGLREDKCARQAYTGTTKICAERSRAVGKIPISDDIESDIRPAIPTEAPSRSELAGNAGHATAIGTEKVLNEDFERSNSLAASFGERQNAPVSPASHNVPLSTDVGSTVQEKVKVASTGLRKDGVTSSGCVEQCGGAKEVGTDKLLDVPSGEGRPATLMLCSADAGVSPCPEKEALEDSALQTAGMPSIPPGKVCSEVDKLVPNRRDADEPQLAERAGRSCASGPTVPSASLVIGSTVDVMTEQGSKLPLASQGGIPTEDAEGSGKHTLSREGKQSQVPQNLTEVIPGASEALLWYQNSGTRSEVPMPLHCALEACASALEQGKRIMLYDGQDFDFENRDVIEKFQKLAEDAKFWSSRDSTEASLRKLQKVRLWDPLKNDMLAQRNCPSVRHLQRYIGIRPRYRIFHPSFVRDALLQRGRQDSHIPRVMPRAPVLERSFSKRPSGKEKLVGPSGKEKPSRALVAIRRIISKIRRLQVTAIPNNAQVAVSFWHTSWLKKSAPRSFAVRADVTRYLLRKPFLEIHNVQEAMLNLERRTSFHLIPVYMHCPARLACFWDTVLKQRIIRPTNMPSIGDKTIGECLRSLPELVLYSGQDLPEFQLIKQAKVQRTRARGCQFPFPYMLGSCGNDVQKYVYNGNWVPCMVNVEERAAAAAVFWNTQTKMSMLEPAAVYPLTVDGYLDLYAGTVEPYQGQDMPAIVQQELQIWFETLKCCPGFVGEGLLAMLLPPKLLVPPSAKINARETSLKLDKSAAGRTRRREDVAGPRKRRRLGNDGDTHDIGHEHQVMREMGTRRQNQGGSRGGRVRVDRANVGNTRRRKRKESGGSDIDGGDNGGSVITTEGEVDLTSSTIGSIEAPPAARQRLKRVLNLIKDLGPKILRKQLTRDLRQELNERMSAEFESTEAVMALLKRLENVNIVGLAYNLCERLALLDVYGCFSGAGDVGYGPANVSALGKELRTGRICTIEEVIRRFREICGDLIQFHAESAMEYEASNLLRHGDELIYAFSCEYHAARELEFKMLRVLQICEDGNRVGFVRSGRRASNGSSSASASQAGRDCDVRFMNCRDENGFSVMAKAQSVRVLGVAIDTRTCQRENEQMFSCHICKRKVLEASGDSLKCANWVFGFCTEVLCRFCVETVLLKDRTEFCRLRNLEQWLCIHCCGKCPKGNVCFSDGGGQKRPFKGEENSKNMYRLWWKVQDGDPETVELDLMRRKLNGDYNYRRRFRVQLWKSSEENDIWNEKVNLPVGAYRCMVWIDGVEVAGTTFSIFPKEDVAIENSSACKKNDGGSVVEEKPLLGQAWVDQQRNKQGQRRIGWHVSKDVHMNKAGTVTMAAHALSNCEGGRLITCCSRTEGYDWRRGKYHAITHWVPEQVGESSVLRNKKEKEDSGEHEKVIYTATNWMSEARVKRVSVMPVLKVGQSHWQWTLDWNSHMYSRMKETVWGIVPGRSDIHGIGLFTLTGYESGDIVIEYAGDLIRTPFADLRERDYQKAGLGTYLFRLNDEQIVDATVQSNRARFTNHSCDPNMRSEIISIHGRELVVLRAIRHIPMYAELTFDYKLPYEDDHKLQCLCNAINCLGVMN